ncbi:hypothetical protein G7Y89_g4128 [Cudoniella acicularis]|uniref:Uncharacterized protein n=1 Tax=Cudoniella acicularis TaxID=354080 RepID=A0A8H4RRF9_9HELO|nr:hypothetical protein G7Y89_g4128 [Cudoniella acicularis]
MKALIAASAQEKEEEIAKLCRDTRTSRYEILNRAVASMIAFNLPGHALERILYKVPYKTTIMVVPLLQEKIPREEKESLSASIEDFLVAEDNPSSLADEEGDFDS